MAYTTINKSTEHFNTKLYTGNGSTQSITGLDFQPDFVWIKERTDGSSHALTDAVRGNTKYISSNSNYQEETISDRVTSFNSDGFSLGGNVAVNQNTILNASWNWKANGSGSANTDGTINSTVSVNTTAGFSIVKFTGTGANGTVGHGLGVKPAMIIQKNLSISSAWSVWHKSFSGSQVIYLNETGAVGSNTSSWNSTEPTSSVFSVGTGSYPNGSGNEQIYYVFAEKTGYSKIGSYTGNGSSSSPSFIYTGFKPKFVIVKNTSQADGWFIHDDKRDGYNDDNEYLFANLSNVEGTNVNRLSMYSNGFNVPTTDKSHNVNGNSYIYMAFGQSLVGSNNVPCTAR